MYYWWAPCNIVKYSVIKTNFKKYKKGWGWAGIETCTFRDLAGFGEVEGPFVRLSNLLTHSSHWLPFSQPISEVTLKQYPLCNEASCDTCIDFWLHGHLLRGGEGGGVCFTFKSSFKTLLKHNSTSLLKLSVAVSPGIIIIIHFHGNYWRPHLNMAADGHGNIQNQTCRKQNTYSK